jgi:hypothetical protein
MDNLFMLYAQACEGELTATKEQLDKISLCLANTYLLDSANPNDPGAHDWCQFYLPSIGWVYADLSLGGAAYRRGDYDLWNFYFGNLDPYRVPINNEFQVEFDPPKKHCRKDPYDNQMGELEYEDGGIYRVSERKVTLTTIEIY